MGYANPAQTGRGIHMRQWSRAFVFEGADGTRAVFASVVSAYHDHTRF